MLNKSINDPVSGVIILLMMVFGLQLSTSAQNADINILKKINNSNVSSGTYKSMRFMSNSATDISLTVPIGLLAVGVIEHNEDMKLKAVYMFESIAIAEGITYALKYSINRPRPFVTYPFIIQKSDAGSPSFPSGHTSLAFSMATSLSIAYPKWYIIAPSMIYASSIGYSRMYLGVHYPSDVLAGALVGAGSSILTYKVNKWLRRSKHKSLSVSW